MKIRLDQARERVVKALGRVDTPLSGRAVARVTGLPQSTAQRALARLVEAGIVVADPVPPSLQYRLNREHVAVAPILELLSLDQRLRARMSDAVAAWGRQPASVIVYGSVARGEATARSDLDLLVVRPASLPADDPVWEAQLTDLADHAQRWSGRSASLVELSHADAAHGMADAEPYLMEADREGWLIGGAPLRNLTAEHPCPA